MYPGCTDSATNDLEFSKIAKMTKKNPGEAVKGVDGSERSEIG